MSKYYLTVVYEVDGAAAARTILDARPWKASSHSNAIHDCNAARLEIESLRERVQELGQLARDVNARRVMELEAQPAAQAPAATVRVHNKGGAGEFRTLEGIEALEDGTQLYAAPQPAAPAQPVAPAMPYPTDAQVDAVYQQTMWGQTLREQDAPSVRRFGRAMFLCAWNSAMSSKAEPAAPAQAVPVPVPAAPEIDIYVWPVPNKCDRIVWRGAYHHLPIQKAAPAQAGEREAFEAWVTASGRAHMLKRDDRNDWYADLTVTAWWTAWQASAARGAAQAAEYAKELDKLSQRNYELRMENAALKAAQAAPVDAATWQPIASAPKDGKAILLRSKNGRIADGLWSAANSHAGLWAWAYVHQEPVEWMPKPGSPAARAQEQQP